MHSIRRRTLLLVLGVLSLSLPLISYQSYRDAQHEIEELFDAQLVQTARLLVGMVSRQMLANTGQALQEALLEAATPHYQAGQVAGPLGHQYENKLSFLVLDAQGRPLLRSASMPANALAELNRQLSPPGVADASATPGPWLSGYRYAQLQGHQWRLFMLHDWRDDLWILVGEREDVRGELAEKIAKGSILPDLIGLPVLALLVWWAVGWGLRPLARMVQLLKTRDPDNLSPLLLAPLPQELEPMAASLNRLLQQVTTLLRREKQFLADAAHELRTPLAVLRIHAQNALEAADPADRQDALQQLGNAIERATRVVAQLLTLARLEPNALELTMTQVDLLRFVRSELAELTPLALQREQELTLEADETADYHLRADAPSLGILLQNLICNAVQHTPPAGRIQVSLEASTEKLILRVQDSGPGVAAKLRGPLFKRFFRHGPGQGAGLGLSIVARVVELHGGGVKLLDSPLGGLEVMVGLPRLPDTH